MHKLNEAEKVGDESEHEVEHQGEGDCEEAQGGEGIQGVELQKGEGEGQKGEF